GDGSHNYVIWDEAAISEPVRLDAAIADIVPGAAGVPESAATRALVDQAQADGDVAAMLRGIAAQEGIDPDQAALALRLAEVVPGLNVTVVPPPAGAAEAGMYDNGTGELWVRQATPSIVLHEVLHGVTSAMLTNPAARRGNPEVAQSVREF